MRRRNALRSCILVATLAGLASACGDGSNDPDGRTTMRTDLEGLRELIQLPAGVEGAEWQTGDSAPHGGDWWLAAVLRVRAEDMAAFLPGAAAEEVFETPAGLEFTSSFASLPALAGAQRFESNRIRLVAETYPADAYAKAPLLRGKAIKLSPNEVLVLLWTG
jgi:hypothetical protein